MINNKLLLKKSVYYIIILILAFLINKNYITGHYATDTYAIINMGYEKYAVEVFLNAGRLFSCLFLLTSGLFRLPIDIFVTISTVLAILISGLSVKRLTRIMFRYKMPKNKTDVFIAFAISFCTIFNFMYIEILYFTEAAVLALAVYLSILSADVLISSKRYGSLKSFFLITMAIFCYNSVYSIYFITVMLLILLEKNNNNKKIIYAQILKSITFVLIALILNFIQIKITSSLLNSYQSRISSVSIWFNNICFILMNLFEQLVNTAKLFPKYLFLAYLLITVSCLIISFKKNKLYLLEILLFIILSILTPFAISIISLSSFGTGRLLIGIGMLIGYLYIIFYVKTSILSEKHIFSYILKFLFLIYFFTNIINYLVITNDYKKINEIEEGHAKEITEYINNYEKENNIKIEYIAMRFIRRAGDQSIL